MTGNIVSEQAKMLLCFLIVLKIELMPHARQWFCTQPFMYFKTRSY